MQPSHTSAVPSELESAESTVGSPSVGQSWQPSWTGSQVPWSAAELGFVKGNSRLGDVYETENSQIYEMSAENEVPTSVPPTPMPAEMPTISVISPPISPTSPHTGTGPNAELPRDPERYEPYRPS